MTCSSVPVTPRIYIRFTGTKQWCDSLCRGISSLVHHSSLSINVLYLIVTLNGMTFACYTHIYNDNRFDHP
jgi:hypothetical protein